MFGHESLQTNSGPARVSRRIYIYMSVLLLPDGDRRSDESKYVPCGGFGSLDEHLTRVEDAVDAKGVAESMYEHALVRVERAGECGAEWLSLETVSFESVVVFSFLLITTLMIETDFEAMNLPISDSAVSKICLSLIVPLLIASMSVWSSGGCSGSCSFSIFSVFDILFVVFVGK